MRAQWVGPFLRRGRDLTRAWVTRADREEEAALRRGAAGRGHQGQ